MKELDALLENLWIVKETDKELYYAVKDASPKFKAFLEEKLGYRLIINAYVIKLEKLPGRTEPWMGIQEFGDRMDYAFLSQLLVYLEDRGVGEQFVLSDVTEFIQASFPGEEKVDWTQFRQRRSMVKVLKFAADIGLVKVDDGDDTGFTDTAETEVLYESTGLSRYFVRNFTGNILNYTSPEDIENGEWLDLDRDRGRVRRNRVYRRLVMSPAVYSEGADDPDYLYIKNFRGMLQKDIEDMLGSRLHIHRNGAFVVLDRDRHSRCTFPDNKAISDIVLQVNGIIVGMLGANELAVHEDDTITISRSRFDRIIDVCRELYSASWSKEYREMPPGRLYEEIKGYMKGFSMLESDALEREIRIMPLVGKITGRYPKDYKPKNDESEGSAG